MITDATEEMSPPSELQRNRLEQRKQGAMRAAAQEEASSDAEMRPAGAVSVARMFTGPTCRPRLPSVPSEASLVIAELAEPSQEVEEFRRQDEELRRQYQELERIVGGTVTAAVIVENGGGSDDDQNEASLPFDRKGKIFLIAAVPG
jgi:hypothetical protein